MSRAPVLDLACQSLRRNALELPTQSHQMRPPRDDLEISVQYAGTDHRHTRLDPVLTPGNLLSVL